MKKIAYTIITGTIVAFTLNSCNNAEEVAKQKEAELAKIQEAVDAKLNELQTEAAASCEAKVDSLATAMYDEWFATEGKKKGAKPVVKPKPTPKTPVAQEPKKDDKPTIGEGKIGSENNKPKIGEGKLGTEKTTEEQKIGKGKLGTKQ